jgi:hypothetical protein
MKREISDLNSEVNIEGNDNNLDKKIHKEKNNDNNNNELGENIIQEHKYINDKGFLDNNDPKKSFNDKINTNTNSNFEIENEANFEREIETDDNEKIDDHIFINQYKLGVQNNDLKFATFDDPHINPLSLININYQNTFDEFNNLISILMDLEEKYEYLISFKRSEIIYTSNKYGICLDVGRIYIIALRRIIELTLYITKTRFCPLEKENIINILKENYLVSSDIYINNFLNYKNLKKIVIENEEKLMIFIDHFKSIKLTEDKMTSYIYNDFVPSITGIFFAIKSMIIFIEYMIKDCEILTNDNIIEDVLIEFLLNV